MGFTKKETNIAKGIAILMLLYHHLFLAGRFEEYGVKFLFLNDSQVANLASSMKICVSMFAFLSGYGLYLSYKNKDKKDNVSIGKWILERYVHSFRGFWIIIILAWIVFLFIKRDRIEMYFQDSVWLSPFYFLFDLTGLAGIMETPKLIATYWYMSAVVIFILAVPVLFKSLEKTGPVVTLAWLIILPRILYIEFPDTIQPYMFITALFAGMVFAKYDCFTKLYSFASKSKIRYFFVTLSCIVSSVLLYRLNQHVSYKTFWEFKYGFVVVIVMMTIYLLFMKIPVVSNVLGFLGIHSANIFMIHNLYRGVFPEKLYCFKYAPLIFIILLAFSLAISLILEFIKKKTDYNNRIEKLLLKKEEKIVRKEETSK